MNSSALFTRSFSDAHAVPHVIVPFSVVGNICTVTASLEMAPPGGRLRGSPSPSRLRQWRRSSPHKRPHDCQLILSMKVLPGHLVFIQMMRCGPVAKPSLLVSQWPIRPGQTPARAWSRAGTHMLTATHHTFLHSTEEPFVHLLEAVQSNKMC